MKKLPLIFILIFFIWGLFFITSYIDRMTPVWSQFEIQNQVIEQQKELLKQQELANKVQNNIARRQAVTEAFPTVVYSIMLIGVGCFGLFVFLKMHNRYEASQRMIDGSFALQWRNIGGVKVLIDPNKLANSFGALTVDNILNSKQAFTDNNSQLKLLEQVNRQRLITAMPDTGFKYAATGKFLAGSYDRQWIVADDTPQIEVEEVPEAKVKALSLVQAVNTSTADAWLMGQNDFAYCELSIRDLVHVGLIGKTGSGKTASTALLATIYALKFGFHVIALDAKGGVDWKDYNNYIEVYKTDYETFPSQIDQLCNLHELRMKELNRYQVSNIDEISDVTIPHILVVFEEFGHVCQALQSANKRAYNETISKMSNLMRVARATGIHFFLIDQLPNHWPQTVKANIGGMIGYRIKGSLANGFGMYKLGDLAPVGQFSYDDEVYNAWFTKGEADKLFKSLPKRKACLLKQSTSETVLDSSVYEGVYTVGASPSKTEPVQSVQSSSNSSHTGNSGSDNGSISSGTEPQLQAEFTLNRQPLGNDEKQEVYSIYKSVGSKTKACKAIWGSKNANTWKWLNEVIEELENKE